MQTISASVGENATNNMSDVALVQAILLETRRAATPATPAGPYLSSYDGDCGAITKAAIRSFQLDHVAQSQNGLAGAPNPSASAGLVKPGDATWLKLLEQVDRDFSDMRVVAGGKTVYLAATPAQLQDGRERPYFRTCLPFQGDCLPEPHARAIWDCHRSMPARGPANFSIAV